MVRASDPLMTPVKLQAASLSPMVSSGVPVLLVTVPLPLRPLIVSLLPTRLSVPAPVPLVLMTTLPLPGPFGIWLGAPRFIV